MPKSAKSKAEAHFTATQRKDQQFLKERDKAQQERAEHTARLRALRLAKEAADREAAEKTAAEKGARKAASKASKKTPDLPQVHRPTT